MYKMIYVDKWFEPFLSSWGVWSHSGEAKEPVWFPLGWEQELLARGISFEERELELPNLSALNNENE